MNLLPASVATARLARRSEHGDLLVVGIRPEQLVNVPYETSSAVQQRLAELARELDAETRRTQLIATLDAETGVAGGQQIELALDPGGLHLFDPVTGTRLTREPLPRAA